MVGRELAPTPGLDEGLGSILKKYQISSLPPMAAAVTFLDHAAKALSLEEALQLPAEYLIHYSMRIIHQGESKLSSQRHGGGLRPRSQVTEIRTRLAKERETLQNEGPARVISAIAFNSGKTARWSRSGLEGIEEDWFNPPDEEVMWWGWLYRKAKQEEEFLRKIDKEKIDLLHAVFIARARRQKGEMLKEDFHRFLAEISGLVPESDSFLVGSLQEVSKGYPISQS